MTFFQASHRRSWGTSNAVDRVESRCARSPLTVTAMSEIVAPGGSIPEVPSNLTIPQFLLDVDWHPARPPLLSRVLNPCMIEDATGRTISFEEVREYTGTSFSLTRFVTSVAGFYRSARVRRVWQMRCILAST